jgi:ribosomal protein S30
MSAPLSTRTRGGPGLLADAGAFPPVGNQLSRRNAIALPPGINTQTGERVMARMKNRVEYDRECILAASQTANAERREELLEMGRDLMAAAMEDKKSPETLH